MIRPETVALLDRMFGPNREVDDLLDVMEAAMTDLYGALDSLDNHASITADDLEAGLDADEIAETVVALRGAVVAARELAQKSYDLFSEAQSDAWRLIGGNQ